MPVRENTVDSWNIALEDGLTFRKEYGREDEWAHMESMFYHANKMQDGNVGPNIIAGTGDALLSQLTVPNPKFLLQPLRMDVIESTPVLESVLNTLMHTANLQESFEEACLHAYLWGRGIVKFGYDSEFGYDPRQDIGQVAQTVLGISLTQFDKKGQRIEFGQATPGMPWSGAVLPHDFVVPYGTKTLKNSPWAAHRIVRHIDDIKADPKYSGKRDLEPQMSMADYVKSYLTVMKPYRLGQVLQQAQRQFSEKAEFVELWEIHDVRTGRVYVISPGYDTFLRNEIDYLQEDGLPFVSIGFVPSARNFWTTPDTVYLKAPQEESVDIATMQKHQRRISLLRFMYEEGSIDNDELEKFMSGEIGVGIKIKTTTSTDPIVAMTPGNSNNQLQSEAEAIRRDGRETVGFSRNQTGEYTPGRHTASEAMIVQENSDQRLNRRQNSLAKAYCEGGQKLAKIIFRLWQTPRLTQIIGPSGAQEWQAFTGSQLKGEYLYSIGFSNEPVKGMEARKAEAMQLYVSLSQDPTIDQIALRRYLARAYNNPEFYSLFLPGVIPSAGLSVPMQQQLMQQQGGGGGGVQPQTPGGAGNGSPVPEVRSPVQPSPQPPGPPRQGMGQQ